MWWGDSWGTGVARRRPKVRPVSTRPATVTPMTLAMTRAPRRGATSMAGMIVLCRYSPPEAMMPSTSMATQQTTPVLSIWSVLAVVPRAGVPFLPAATAVAMTLITARPADEARGIREGRAGASFRGRARGWSGRAAGLRDAAGGPGDGEYGRWRAARGRSGARRAGRAAGGGRALDGGGAGRPSPAARRCAGRGAVRACRLVANPGGGA